MSIMNEYTIETALDKDEVIKIITANTKDANTKGIFSVAKPDSTLTFYGRVDEDEFRVHPTHHQYLTHWFAALEGSVADEYDCTKITVQPKGLSAIMILSLISMPIAFAIVAYVGFTYGDLPINIILPIFGTVTVLNIAMMLGYSRYYIHRAKTKLQELFTT